MVVAVGGGGCGEGAVGEGEVEETGAFRLSFEGCVCVDEGARPRSGV